MGRNLWNCLKSVAWYKHFSDDGFFLIGRNARWSRSSKSQNAGKGSSEIVWDQRSLELMQWSRTWVRISLGVLMRPSSTAFQNLSYNNGQLLIPSAFEITTMSSDTWVLFGAFVFASAIFFLSPRIRSKIPLPPGPKGLPFFGVKLSQDMSEPWLSYKKLADTYGAV